MAPKLLDSDTYTEGLVVIPDTLELWEEGIFMGIELTFLPHMLAL